MATKTNSKAVREAKQARLSPAPEAEPIVEDIPIELTADQVEILTETYRHSEEFRRAVHPWIAQAQQEADRVKEELEKLSPSMRARLLSPFLSELAPQKAPARAPRVPSAAVSGTDGAASSNEPIAKRGRATSAETEQAMARILDVLRKHPQGIGKSELLAAAKVDPTRWPGASGALKEAGSIFVTGSTRSALWHAKK